MSPKADTPIAPCAMGFCRVEKRPRQDRLGEWVERTVHIVQTSCWPPHPLCANLKAMWSPREIACAHGKLQWYRSAVKLGVRSLVHVILFGICSFSADSAEQDWQAGIAGGIPYSRVAASVGDYGTTGDGVTDDARAFQAAIDAVSSTGGGALLVPSGTYMLRSTLRLRDGVVLRGEGAESTYLKFDLGGRSDAAILGAEYLKGPSVRVSGGFQKGSTEITVVDPRSFKAPGFAEIEQANDPQLMYTDPEWDQSWAEYAVGEVVRVVDRVGNTLILDRPLSFSYNPTLEPRIHSLEMLEWAGVEDLHIERLDAGDGYTINFENAAWVWVRGVESAMTYRSHVQVETGYECEIRASYLHHAHDYGGGGHGLGVKLTFHTTACLVEDNIFVSLRHAMTVSIGANGNVFGYNYSREPKANKWWGYVPNDISLHGHYPSANLFEGNVVQHIAVADYWGPAGPDNLLLRNCVEDHGIYLYDHSHYQSVIGNTLAPDAPIFIADSVKHPFVHGNYVGGSVQWDESTADHAISTSSYHDRRPWFFDDDAEWPSIGPDKGTACVNPARQRWQSGHPTPQISATSYRILRRGYDRISPGFSPMKRAPLEVSE